MKLDSMHHVPYSYNDIESLSLSHPEYPANTGEILCNAGVVSIQVDEKFLPPETVTKLKVCMDSIQSDELRELFIGTQNESDGNGRVISAGLFGENSKHLNYISKEDASDKGWNNIDQPDIREFLDIVERIKNETRQIAINCGKLCDEWNRTHLQWSGGLLEDQMQEAHIVVRVGELEEQHKLQEDVCCFKIQWLGPAGKLRFIGASDKDEFEISEKRPDTEFLNINPGKEFTLFTGRSHPAYRIQPEKANEDNNFLITAYVYLKNPDIIKPTISIDTLL